MRRSTIVFAFGVLAACNQSAEQPAGNATANAAAPAKKPGFCFFKPEEMKGWTATTDAKGNITVTGKAHVKDSRYVAQLGEPDIAGSTASVALTIAQNSGSYGANEDWWDVKAAIPANPALRSVSVTCGGKAVADLPLKRD
jgi:hypothetical protein